MNTEDSKPGLLASIGTLFTTVHSASHYADDLTVEAVLGINIVVLFVEIVSVVS